MAILLKFHGALDEVTGSCHFFKIKGSGNIYAVDCGATQGDDARDQPAHPRNLPADCKPDMLSGILLTHAHGDHISHLPRWFKAGFKGPIFCTAETAKLANIALEDSRRIEGGRNEVEGGFDYVDDKSFEQTIDALRNPTLVTPGRRQALENNVSIEAAMTSHLLGCCGFRISTEHGSYSSSVFFTGDIGPIEHGDETRSLYAERQRPASHSDYIVTESTYGSRPRSKDSQSGLKRLDRLCQVLRAGFRHRDKSVVFIPAFSLQRTIDVLVDVFCALHFNRDKVGLEASDIPLVTVHSKLSQGYAETYRDFYYRETREGFRMFNKHAALHRITEEHDEHPLLQLDNLLPRSRNARVVRYGADSEWIETEIQWGGWSGGSNRPTVVICGSGMTLNGPIVEYMANYLGRDYATFVLCGYVPPGSAGERLRALCEVPRELRSTFAIKLPGDARRHRQPKVFSGADVKCGYENISEFYSGHADGASIIRYILGEQLEHAGATKGIFLVHGDRSARQGLKQLIEASCADKGMPCPKVYLPMSEEGWFDCDASSVATNPFKLSNAVNRVMEDPRDMLASADTQAEWSGIVIPDSIEIETAVVVSNALPVEEVIETLRAAFDFARPEPRGSGLLLKINRPGQPHSTVMLAASRIGDGLLKLTAESRIMQAMSGDEMTEAALDWRRVLNALKAPKDRYFAGARYIQTEDEIAGLIAACTPVIFSGKQRLQPVLLLPNALLASDEMEGVARLLTPTVLLAILGEDGRAAINRFLGLEGSAAMTSRSAIYLPLIAKGGARVVTDGQGRLLLDILTSLVTSDTLILNAREPQLHAARRQNEPQPETAPNAVRVTQEPANSHKQKLGLERMALPPESFMEHAVGQKVRGKLEHVRRKKDTDQFIFAIYRLEGSEITGILHHTSLAGPIDENLGTELELWIRSVTPEHRNLTLSNIPVDLPAEAMLSLAKSMPTVTPNEIAELLGGPSCVNAVCRAADDSFLATRKAHPPVIATTGLDAPRAIDAYNRAVHALGFVGKSRAPAPAPLKGPTYGDIAAELGYSVQNLIDAAGHMIGDPECYELGITVLPSGFTPRAESPFPSEAADRFLGECRARAERGWQPSMTKGGEINPDCHSIDSLARLLGIPQPTLLARLEAKGIKPEVRVVVTTEDIQRLIGQGLNP